MIQKYGDVRACFSEMGIPHAVLELNEIRKDVISKKHLEQIGETHWAVVLGADANDPFIQHWYVSYRIEAKEKEAVE